MYAYGPEGFAAQRAIVSDTPQPVAYPLLDGQASVRHLSDASGNLVLSRRYDAWGNIRYSTGTATTRLGYTGELHTGSLIYLRARWYNTILGTFTSRDTFLGLLGTPQSLHRYRYAHNNPLRYTDPSGHCVLAGIDTLVCAGVTITVGAVLAFAATIGAIVVLYALYDSCIVRHGCENFFAWVDTHLNELIPKTLPPGTLPPDAQPSVLPQYRPGTLPQTFEPPVPAPAPAPEPASQPQPQPEPAHRPRPWPLPLPEPICEPEPSSGPSPTDEPDKVVRVRHYSRRIDAIRTDMLIKVNPPMGPFIWVEYPVVTPSDEQAIQRRASRFFIAGKVDGFVEFNVDLDKWTLKQDDNMPWDPNAKMIELGIHYVMIGFPLNEPGVNPAFFDAKGNPK